MKHNLLLHLNLGTTNVNIIKRVLKEIRTKNAIEYTGQKDLYSQYREIMLVLQSEINVLYQRYFTTSKR